jgi:UDP-N-acetyl-D-glucosamine dehydrogenase
MLGKNKSLSQAETRRTARQQCKNELLRAIEDRTVRCGVIGLGFIGSVLMDALIESGLEAHGYDRHTPAVEHFRNWIAARHQKTTRPFSASTSQAPVLDCDAVFIAVRNPVEAGVVIEEPQQAACRLLRTQLKCPRLIILESTVIPGSTRKFAAALDWARDEGTFIAHAPERLSAGHDREVLRKTPHLIGGLDQESTELGRALLGKLCDTVVPVSSPEVCELSKLLENAFLSVNIGLISEITRIAHSFGIQAQEVCQAAATKPFGYFPFYPGPGVGGHCLPNDLALLADVAISRGWNPELLSAAMTVNDRAPKLVVDRLQHLLEKRGLSLTGAAVLLVGVGFKPGSSDTAMSPAFGIARALRERASEPFFTDSGVFDFTVDGVPVPAIRAPDLFHRKFTATVILAGDPQLKTEDIRATSGLVLDTMGRRQKTKDALGLEML